MLRLDDLQSEIARLEQQIAQSRRAPGPGSAQNAPTTVSSESAEPPTGD
jgi:hypothetical protein